MATQNIKLKTGFLQFREENLAFSDITRGKFVSFVSLSCLACK